MTDYKSIKYNISGADLTGLTAGQIPNLDTAKITSGTLALARISADSVTQHVTETDLTPVRQDVLTLALKQATQENSTKFNLPNSAITKFEADADFNLAGSTDIGRNASEYIESQTTTVGSAIEFPYHSIAAADRAKLYRIGSATQTNTTWETVGDTAAGGSDTHENISSGTDNAGAMHAYYSTNGTTDWSKSYIVDFTNELTFSDKLRIGKKSNWGDAKTWWVQYSTDNTNWTNVDFSSASETDYGGNSPTSTDGRFVSGTSAGRLVVSEVTELNNVWGTYTEVDGIGDFTARYFRVQVVDVYSAYNDATGMADFMPWYKPTTVVVNATGTALGTTNVPSSAVTDVSGVMLLKDAYGSTTLGTDVKVYFSADNSAWTEAASYSDAGTFSTGIKMIKLGKTVCTSGSDVRWKVVWANQVADTKVSYIYGLGINY